MTVFTKQRKHWSESEKLEILNHYPLAGIHQTMKEFGISATTVYKRRDKYEEHGGAGLKGKPIKGNTNTELERLKRELKAIVAEKQLTLCLQRIVKKSR